MADDVQDFRVRPAWKKASLIAAFYFLAVMAIYYSQLRTGIDSGFTRKVEYQTRSLLGRSPTLDPRLKMIAFDDTTAGILQRPDLTLQEWALLFEYLAAGNPKVIFIDRIFGLPLGARLSQGVGETEATKFIERMQKLGVPLVVGSFYQPDKITYRSTLNIERNEFNLSSITKDQDAADFPSWFEPHTGFIYGPHQKIERAFTLIGSIDNEGGGYIKPFRRLDQDHVLLHTSLLIAGDVEFRDGHFWRGPHRMPIDGEGRLLVNLSDRETYYRQTKNLLWFIKQLNDEKPLEWITDGDIVAVLPMMYTGNTDMKDVPIGRLQGSYVQASAINNALHGNWLRSTPAIPVLFLLAVALATLAASILSALKLSIVTVGYLAVVVISGLASFVYADVIFPWPYVAFAFLATSITVFTERTRRTELLKQQAEAKAQEGVRVRKLLHVVCHDIASPLMVLTTRLMMLGADYRRVNDPQAEATKLDKVAYAGERIRNIVDAVRSLEAVETGKAKIQLQPVAVRTLFEAMQMNFEDSLKKKGVELATHFEPADADPWVEADPTSLENFVIANLVSNAIKFSASGDTITLTARTKGGRVELEVKDQGIGIPPDLLEKIFSSTAVTSREGTNKEQGTGFGMPIVKSYVEKFGGTIDIFSQEKENHPQDHGTRIVIQLHIANEPKNIAG